LSEFHQIYVIGADWVKDELIRFRVQKVKGQGHNKNKYGKKSPNQIHCTFPVKDYWLMVCCRRPS